MSTLVHPAVVATLPLDGPISLSILPQPIQLVPRPPPPPGVNEVMLAPLASQHHTSEYNRLKFGPQGCPFIYVPLSIHLPDYYLQLQHRQQQCTGDKTWWPCAKTPASLIILGSRGAQPQDSHLQQEIEAAMSEPLANLLKIPDSHTTGPSSHPVKTSSTHPINISYIIPQELIPLISSHLLLASASPTILEIPYSFTLDHLLAPSSTLRQIQHPEIFTNPFPPIQPQIIVKHLRTRTKVTEALQAAMNGSFSPLALPGAIEKDGKCSTPPVTRRPASTDILPSDKLATMTHSNSSSISLSLSLTITDPPSSNRTSKKTLNSKSSVSSLNEFEIVQPLIGPPAPAPEAPLLIGNLFLSSCPGKKVRLQGPVKGRSAVCRDLNLDLRRMKELGVGCVICCLDDEELDFLGAPWPEYESLANANGIDVLRIPIPEGLAPMSPASLDAGLTKVINTYTLNGVPVLVHCRGGVGRAGVIACCWIIRLGLCGWIEPQTPFLPNGSTLESPISQPHDGVEQGTSSPRLRRDTIQFVQKVIAVARQRRSLKAIETYEQVRFLVDFVEYLRDGHHSDDA
ncbi:hypothetical protein DXG01_004818 [Tephrocybe rancida]|nr:hypothetical protein DXG01_004818 [Tephrocybe rancida]